MTDVPNLEKKNLANSVAIYARGRKLFRPPMYVIQQSVTILPATEGM
jgi:hypothetical protein